MIIAIEGCCHGELDSIYASLALAEQTNGVKVDLLLICGDFQSVRNAADLAGMACPPKYRAMQTFYKYYSGEKVAPVLTLFIGGNHEASAYLCELPYGGWVAPNIYYLGFSSVVTAGGVRIGGLTGIYKSGDYQTGHYERPPFNDGDMRSFYHIREIDVLQLRSLRRPMDIFLSHDWPQHIAKHGNLPALLRRKSFLQAEIADGSLGSPPGLELLRALRPSYWFAAHLHVKFAAAVPHPDGSATRFLSLSKVLPNHDFLQLVEVPRRDGLPDGAPISLCYDAEWLAVLRATAHLPSAQRGRLPLHAQAVAAVSGGRSEFAVSEADESAVVSMASGHQEGVTAGPAVVGSLAVPLNFAQTAAAYRPGESITAAQAPFAENPQTTHFVATFGLPADFRSQRGATRNVAPQSSGGGGGGGGSLHLPPPVSSEWSAQQPPDPASYYAQGQAVAGPQPVAHAMGLLDPVTVPTLDEEIDLDDD